MADPYITPRTSPPPNVDDEELRRKRKFWIRALWFSIAGVIFPPLIATLITGFTMIRSFSELSQGNEADPDKLNPISISLLLTAWGLLVSIVAFMVLIGVLIRFFSLPKISKAGS